jgi:hypothetical protein
MNLYALCDLSPAQHTGRKFSRGFVGQRLVFRVLTHPNSHLCRAGHSEDLSRYSPNFSLVLSIGKAPQHGTPRTGLGQAYGLQAQLSVLQMPMLL